jgi:uncharacterized LabA/DUF88 family protein
VRLDRFETRVRSAFSLGYLLKDRKGVDVNIAIDLLVAAYENLCERLYLVSSDTDLIPAIAKAQEKGITVVYVHFPIECVKPWSQCAAKHKP